MGRGNKGLAGLGITGKMVGLLLVFGLVPTAIVAVMGLQGTQAIEQAAGERFEVESEGIGDRIDRSLFERYGDVQAFASNRILQEKYSWYVQDPKDNEIIRTMNDYVKAYGIYYLMIFVDLEGDVIATNSIDAQGNDLDTKSLYKKNFKNSPWFQAVSQNQFTTKMPFTAPGNDVSTGTFVEDVMVDQDVLTAYPGDSGLTLGFSAPVYQNGVAIGYWTNRAKFSLVEEVVASVYPALKRTGFTGAEITVLNERGQVILDFDPSTTGTETVPHDLQNVLLKLNLAEMGVEAAQKAIAGKKGHMVSLHARKQIHQMAGYAHLKGALGFPGMNWSVLVRVPVDRSRWPGDRSSTKYLGVCIGLSLGHHSFWVYHWSKSCATNQTDRSSRGECLPGRSARPRTGLLQGRIGTDGECL